MKFMCSYGLKDFDYISIYIEDLFYFTILKKEVRESIVSSEDFEAKYAILVTWKSVSLVELTF
jgi:hypothetical protein